VADVMAGDAKANAATHDGIVPATPILAEVERSLSGKIGRELVLRKSLRDARARHDLILIDCPPALGLLTINGLVAADWALISSEAQYFALQGVEGALEVIEQAREFYNPDLQWLGVLLNIADMRTTHSRDALAQLKEHFGDKVFDTVIRASIAYAESAEKAVSILDHRPDLGADYVALADEILGRLGQQGARRRLRAQLAAANGGPAAAG
jgi:chromosome partitioning protein